MFLPSKRINTMQAGILSNKLFTICFGGLCVISYMKLAQRFSAVWFVHEGRLKKQQQQNSKYFCCAPRAFIKVQSKKTSGKKLNTQSL